MIEGHHVVPMVVSDGSTDRTAAVAREAGAFVAELRSVAAGASRSVWATRSRFGWERKWSSRSTPTGSTSPRRSPS